MWESSCRHWESWRHITSFPLPCCFRSRNKKGRSVTKVRHQARVLQKAVGCIPKYCRIRMLEYMGRAPRFVIKTLATAGEIFHTQKSLTLYIYIICMYIYIFFIYIYIYIVDVYSFGDSDWWFILSQEPTLFQKLVYETLESMRFEMPND